MNNIVILGRITKELELKIVKDDVSLLEFSIAVNKTGKKSDKANFFNVVAFGKTAENISKYFDKGHRILINGELSDDQYKNNSGHIVYKTSITVRSFTFIEKRDEKPEKTTKERLQEIANGLDRSNATIQAPSPAKPVDDDEVPF